MDHCSTLPPIAKNTKVALPIAIHKDNYVKCNRFLSGLCSHKSSVFLVEMSRGEESAHNIGSTGREKHAVIKITVTS